MIAARWRRAPEPSGLLRAVRDMINDRNWREGAILPSDAHVRFWAAAIVTATTEMRRNAAIRRPEIRTSPSGQKRTCLPAIANRFHPPHPTDARTISSGFSATAL